MSTPRFPSQFSRPPVPPHIVVDLLEHIAATAVDEDYATAAARRTLQADHPGDPGAPDRASRAKRRFSGRALAVLLLFGLLVATAAVQTRRDAGQSASSRESLVRQADAGKDDLNRRRALVRVLQAQISTLRAQTLEETGRGRTAQAQLTRLGILAGTVSTRGPGIQVHVDDAPGATSYKERVQAPDLQRLVNGVWQAGAEAVAVNGQRLTSQSAIRDAAGGITVNLASLNRPYVVSAIGDPQRLAARLLDTAGGQAMSALQSNLGLTFAIDDKDSMVLPAARGVTLRSAHEPVRRR